MSKRYTFREDKFIVAYLDGVGAKVISAYDLNRSEASIKRRAAFLKDCGAWAAIEKMNEALAEYVRCVGGDEFDQTMATIASAG